MHHESNRAGQGTEDVRHGDCMREQHHSIRPGAFCPPTVLVASTGNEALSAQDRWSGQSGCLIPIDATPRRRELAATSEDAVP